ncbi:MAG TPA: recombinase family protein [Nocardioides sp.]|uniref:recombinase family protein n=1 Tax=uncultured Nocardioides sp. TaxID=198441 RepID=UPI000EBC553B|nr:recombinase family protein [uncultured Nocardioides sp.]HCB06284.1 recombinase family protein [Nocardioides sp.]HRD61326.1 recombinase family protein [Nocardioides sp.]HRI94412.1 recombinase family protein [Nocardioides sp.]HRK44336.1 recombinase family protein [Nocardioides sp.]
MRAAIYTRISKDREGAGLGVQTQEADCRQLATSLGADVVKVLTDNDLSAYSGKPRPGYRDLLALIANGGTDVVIVWHTDRLHRSPAELEEYITLCETTAVRTITVKAGDLDLASPSGLVMARTLGAFARYEVDHARERMHRAKQRSADAGKWKGGRRPFGYLDDGVTLDEREADAIRVGADMILSGQSVRAVARAWNAEGITTTTGRRWKLDAPRRVLLRPRNAGLMEHRGEVIGDAEWPAVIEPEKWRAVVGILTDPARRTNTANVAVRWLGSGLYRCSVCGDDAEDGTVRGDRGRGDIPTYRCRDASHVTRAAEPVDDLVRGVVVERLRRPDLADLLAPSVPEVDIRALEKRATELTERKNQLGTMFAQGTIDAEQLAAGTKSIVADLEDVRGQLQAAYSGSALDGIASAPDPGAAFLAADLDRQRLVVDALIEVTLLPSGKGRPKGWEPGQPYFRPETVSIEWKDR